MAGVTAGWLFLIACIAVPLHMYRRPRGAYGPGRWSGLARMVPLFLTANVAIMFFALLLIGMGLVG